MTEENPPKAPDVPEDGGEGHGPPEGEEGHENEEFLADASSEALRRTLQNRRARASGEEQEELTPEEQQALRKSFEKIRRVLNPFVNIRLPTYKFPQTRQLGFSSAVMENLMGASGVYDQNAKSYLPAMQIRQNWIKNMGIINSDFIKDAGLLQMQPLIQQLAKNVDFGVLGQYAKVSEQIGVQQASWFKNIIPSFDKLKAAFWPSNLREIEELGRV